MHISQYTRNVVAKYDRNHDGIITMQGIPALGIYPEASGRAADFFQRTSPIPFITQTAIVQNAVWNHIDTNHDQNVGFFEGVMGWLKFGVNGLF